MQDGVKTTDYEKRENLIRRTIALENTGETPFMTLYGYYPAKVHGYTCRDIMVDYDKTMDAYVKTTETLKPAAHDNPFPTRFYGRLLEATDFQTMKWPGHGVGEMSGIQFVEAENMKADEYQELLADPRLVYAPAVLAQNLRRLRRTDQIARSDRPVRPPGFR